jgi:protein involved in polysaccharide export with SLBB domain
MPFLRSGWYLVGVLVLGLTGCQAPRSLPPETQALILANKRSLIAVGDMLEIKFTSPAELPPTLKARVGRDGTISLPFQVTVTALGETPSSLASNIISAYPFNSFVKLQVKVTLDSGVCFILGEVSHPGRVFVGRCTAMRAIDIAGGLTKYADRKKIQLIRSNGEMVWVDWNKARNKPKLDPVVDSHGGDVIVVPRLPGTPVP